MIGRISGWIAGLVALLALVALALAASCQTAQVADAEHPDTFIAAAYQAMGRGQSVPAKQALTRAEALCTQQGNAYGMAETHVAWGNYYKNEFLQPDDVNVARSLEHFNKARAIFEQNGWKFGLAKTLYGIGEAMYETDQGAACAAWKQSATVYRQARQGTQPPDREFIVRTAKDFPTLVESVQAALGCPSTK